jgi:GxxExxY protein
MAEILYKDLSFSVVGAAMEVHGQLGGGFLESVYHTALAFELGLRGIPFESRKPLPVLYKGQLVGQYEADLVVDGLIILELKSVQAISAAHIAQAHHYLAATGLRLAIIMNFGAMSLETKRIAK